MNNERLWSQTSWQEYAICAQTDGDAFFSDKGEAGRSEAVLARRICQTCQVALLCLNSAITNGERNGTWGGFSGKPLKKLTSNDETFATTRELYDALDRLNIKTSVRIQEPPAAVSAL